MYLELTVLRRSSTTASSADVAANIGPLKAGNDLYVKISDSSEGTAPATVGDVAVDIYTPNELPDGLCPGGICDERVLVTNHFRPDNAPDNPDVVGCGTTSPCVVLVAYGTDSAARNANYIVRHAQRRQPARNPPSVHGDRDHVHRVRRRGRHVDGRRDVRHPRLEQQHRQDGHVDERVHPCDRARPATCASGTSTRRASARAARSARARSRPTSSSTPRAGSSTPSCSTASARRRTTTTTRTARTRTTSSGATTATPRAARTASTCRPLATSSSPLATTASAARPARAGSGCPGTSSRSTSTRSRAARSDTSPRTTSRRTTTARSASTSTRSPAT